MVIGNSVTESLHRRYSQKCDQSTAPTDMMSTEEEDYIKIRIGDPDITVQGLQTYVVTYTVIKSVHRRWQQIRRFIHRYIGTKPG